MLDQITILTGAGISAESGISTFRSDDGLWENEPVQEVCTYEGFSHDKKRVHDFYNRLRAMLPSKQPNAAHLALAMLQELWPQKYGGQVHLITQNIDDLHDRAHSKDIVHMHGELNSMLCENCGRRYPYFEDSSPDLCCALCHCQGSLRPDIVFFGEMPYHMSRIAKLLEHCQLFISIGTSGVVYPAAGFCQYAHEHGAYCVEINLEHSAVASNFDFGIYQRASVAVPRLVEQLLSTGEFDSEHFNQN